MESGHDHLSVPHREGAIPCPESFSVEAVVREAHEHPAKVGLTFFFFLRKCFNLSACILID